MRIVHIQISHFRGIRHLDWHLPQPFLCLVGPGDSTKTTILDAIDLVLTPRYSPIFTDADFYNCDSSTSISIDVTIADAPDELIKDDRFGLYTRGYKSHEPPFDDPDDDSIPVLTLNLTVDDTLEPQWRIVKPSMPEPKPVSGHDREKFGLARLGDEPEKHLTWSRGSALVRVSGKHRSSYATLAVASRTARSAVARSTIETFDDVVRSAKKAVGDFGVDAKALRAALDSALLTIAQGAVALHDGDIPLRGLGLGSRRLVALAIQHMAIGHEAIIVIDEVEHGLEPHRIRNLLRALANAKGASTGQYDVRHGQVLMTTHSPTVIVALPITCLGFARCTDGNTIVENVSGSEVEVLQPIVRSHPMALLAPRVVMCEGKTELALLRAIDGYWSAHHRGVSLRGAGCVAAEGGGRTQAPGAAIGLKRLGYSVAYLGDSDKPMNPSEATVRAANVAVFLWEGDCSIEERIALDLPLPGLQTMLDIGIGYIGERSLCDKLTNTLRSRIHSPAVIQQWIAAGVAESELRHAIGKVMKADKWSKDLNSAEAIGRVVAEHLASIPDSALAKTLNDLATWAYG